MRFHRGITLERRDSTGGREARLSRGRAGWPVVALALVAVTMVQCTRDAREPFTWAIEPSLADDFPEFRQSEKGDRPLAGSQDENGLLSVFVANEVVLSPAGEAELAAFLARHGGTVIETNAIPQPPPGLDVSLTAEEMAPTEYAIRLDPGVMTLDTFAEDGRAAGFRGNRTFSSEEGAKLMALILRELRGGAEISPNYVFFPAAELLTATEEHPQGGSFLDAFSWTQLRFASTMTGSKSSVLEAWQFVRAHGIERRVNVAIIDIGFWLDAEGNPGSVLASGVSDLHGSATPDQYDFNGDDFLAGGPNPGDCCPWHGNDSASIATGRADNQYGAAGTGGWVSNPILFKTDLTNSQVRRAVRTAVEWKADVISMSFGGNCNLDCAAFPGTAGFWLVVAQSENTVAVAAAGNDGKDAGGVYPCAVPGVICVGAVADGSNTRFQGPGWASNFGAAVDIYAPTNIATTPNPGSQPNLASGGGTSASAPFVAGIAAMMKAIDPALDPAQIGTLLRGTAWTDSPDPRVGRYVNAFAAVKAAAGDSMPPDSLEPNDSLQQRKAVALGQPYEMTIFPDADHYWFELQDYSEVAINLQYMTGLGDVSASLTGGGDKAPKVEEKVTTWTLGKVYNEKLMPPGSHGFMVYGNALNHYHLAVQASSKALEPDQFEVNDTLPTAAAPANGSYLVNLHVAGDTDFYSFAVGSTPLFQTFEFSIGFSDAGPLELRLFKNGVEVGPVPPTGVSLQDPGLYTLQVSGPGPTRYSFKAGLTTSKEALPEIAVPVDKFWFIDHTDAVRRWLLDAAEGLAFTQTVFNLEAFEGFELLGEGLHLTLFDSAGTVVAEGESLAGPDAGAGERLRFEQTVADETYVLLVERQEPDDLPEEASRPLIGYDLSWTSF